MEIAGTAHIAVEVEIVEIVAEVEIVEIVAEVEIVEIVAEVEIVGTDQIAVEDMSALGMNQIALKYHLYSFSSKCLRTHWKVVPGFLKFPENRQSRTDLEYQIILANLV
eukprot:NODE_656_length_5493_cov_0.311828.p5 type:complete len:109 gc:universal NODE_656_length_5493_cov_0.311828:547-873(+)